MYCREFTRSLTEIKIEEKLFCFDQKQKQKIEINNDTLCLSLKDKDI